MDYFARIQAKLTGEAPAIRPRTASWFADPVEPASVLAGDGGDARPASPMSRAVADVHVPGPTEPDSTGPAPLRGPAFAAAEPYDDTPTVRPPHRAEQSHRAPERPGLHAAPDVAGDAPLLPPRWRAETDPPAGTKRSDTPVSLPAEEAGPVARRRPDVPPARDVAPARTEMARVPGRPQSVPAEPAPAVFEVPAHTLAHAPAMREVIARAPDHPALPPDAPPPLLTANGPPPALLLPVPGARRTPDVAERSRQAEAVPGPPVIEVTIGRVDVRAVAGPAARPPAESGPGPMSLQEYLRRQAGAGA